MSSFASVLSIGTTCLSWCVELAALEFCASFQPDLYAQVDLLGSRLDSANSVSPPPLSQGIFGSWFDRTGSMVGKQDRLKDGDRVQFAEMTHVSELHTVMSAAWQNSHEQNCKLSHFWHDVYSAGRLKILDCNERLHVLTSCSYPKILPAWCLKGSKRFVQLRSCQGTQKPKARRWSVVLGGAARGHLEETESVSVAH